LVEGALKRKPGQSVPGEVVQPDLIFEFHRGTPSIDPPRDTEAAKTAPVVSTYTFPGPNMTPAETWTSGHRTPYGLAFSPTGELWEVEHGPKGGDKLNMIEKGKNYGWPLVSVGDNYNGVPVPKPNTRPDIALPAIYWVPVIAPGNLMFYTGTQGFPQWNGSGFVSGLVTKSLVRITFDGHGGAKAVDRWEVGRRIRDIEEAPRWLAVDAGGCQSGRADPRDPQVTASQ
jgi:glucose/arabinose dehydrogenase